MQIVSTTLGPVSVGGVDNLYTIPYYADGWDFDANSFHAVIDTTALTSNHRYLFVIDVFDSTGKRLVPNNSGPAGAGETAKAFTYQRKNPTADPNIVDLQVVPFKALCNLFKVDNVPVTGVIKGLHQSGSIDKDFFAGCQFLTGPPDDTVGVYYRAHHPNGWLASVSLSVREGIGGPVTPLITASTTPSDTTDSGAGDLLTQAVSFGSLLGADPKCSFAANLLVTTRHTNGSSSLTNLWAPDTAAFALEQT
jgi:hypothetical protein